MTTAERIQRNAAALDADQSDAARQCRGERVTCDHDGCTANRECGFVYCAEHLSVEIDRWLDDAEADANLSL